MQSWAFDASIVALLCSFCCSGDAGFIPLARILHSGVLFETTEHGNPFCWESGINFANCCVYPQSKACWDGATYTFETCCYTAPVHWMTLGTTGDKVTTRVRLQMKSVAFWRDYDELKSLGQSLQHHVRHLSPQCFYAVSNLQAELFSDNAASCPPLQSRVHLANFEYSEFLYQDGFRLLNVDFTFCVPIVCNTEEVAAVVAPLMFGFFVNKFSDSAVALQRIQVHTTGGSPAVQTGSFGHRSPPAALEDISLYISFFRICGSCNLSRHGAPRD